MQDSPPDGTPRRGVFASLFAELRRRRVNHVAGLYLMGALAVIGYGGDILDNLDAPPSLARWLTLLVIAGFPVAVAVSWVYDFRVDREQEPGGRPYSAGLRGALILAGGIAIGMGIMVTVAFLSRESRAAANGSAITVPVVGVLPIQMATGEQGAWLARVLEESVTSALNESKGVSVRSQEVVGGYGTLPVDSLARMIRTDYLVSARLLTTDAESRLTVQVLDTAGTLVGSAATLVAGAPSVATAEALTERARDHVLETLGSEVRVAQWRFGTRSDEAFNLLYRADELIRQARQLVGERGGAAVASGLLDEADALLLESSGADPAWPAPRLLRARLANVRAYSLASAGASAAAIASALDSGVTIAGRVLARWPEEAEAHAIRGMLHNRKTVFLDLDPAARREVMAAAEADLRRGLQLDASMAGAAAELSGLLFNRAEFGEARRYADDALRLDSYGADAAAVSQRLAMATFELGNDTAALATCHEGLRRFNDAASFHGCALEVLAFGTVTPDIAEAWHHFESLRANPLLAPRTVAFYEAQMAAVLARANQADSASRVLERVLAAHGEDFRASNLSWLEAAVRFRLGQQDTATRLLRAYAASGDEGIDLNLNRRALKPYRQLLAVELPPR